MPPRRSTCGSGRLRSFAWRLPAALAVLGWSVWAASPTTGFTLHSNAEQRSKAVPPPWGSARNVVYGDRGFGWVSVDVHSRELRPIALPHDVSPFEVATASDGRIVYTARDPAAANTLLFIWDSRHPDSQPKSIGDSRGFHSTPTITPDENWVYFAHNPDAFGPPGQHSPRAYAQIYRVRLDGTGLEALTSNEGCHWGPTALADKFVAFIHSDCVRGKWVELLRGEATDAVTLTERQAILGGVDAAPDGWTLLIETASVDASIVQEVTLTTGATRELFRTPRGALQPRYGGSREEVLYQAHGAVWAWRQGASTKLGAIGGKRQ
jgi:hypothetical protein